MNSENLYVSKINEKHENSWRQIHAERHKHRGRRMQRKTESNLKHLKSAECRMQSAEFSCASRSLTTNGSNDTIAAPDFFDSENILGKRKMRNYPKTAAQNMDAERTYKPRLAQAEKKRKQALNT